MLGGLEKVSTSVEIPFSPACKDAIERTRIEADDLKNAVIGAEHIVLGVLVKTSGDAARALHAAGVSAADVRDHLRRNPPTAVAGSVSRSGPVAAVSRHWKGVVKRGQESAYVDHLQRHTLPALAALTGFVNAAVLRRDVDEGTEFQVITTWTSRSAIEAFAGLDIDAAVVPLEAQALMTSYDRRVVHYEIVP